MKVMKFYYKRRIYLFFCCFTISALCGQSLPIKHYTVKDGLASASVNAVFQDSRGYLWIGTQHGISRFDGLEFQNFYAGEQFKRDYIMAIGEDEMGNIWFGTFGGGAICYDGERFIPYTRQEGLVHDHVTVIAKAPDGNLWFGTVEGLSIYDGIRFNNYTHVNGLSRDFITALAFDRLGHAWIGTDEGLIRFNRRRFKTYSIDNGLSDNYIQGLLVDRDGDLWIGSRGGLDHCPDGHFITISSPPEMKGRSVRAITRDTGGGTWFGTEKGISYYANRRFTHFDTRSGLPNDKIFTLFQDREGNTWFGTSLGLSRLHSLRMINFSVKDGLPNNLVWAMIQDNPGRYWFGTDGGLSCYYNGRFTHLTAADGLANDCVYAIMSTPDGRLWIGTSGGLTIYTPSRRHFKTITGTDGLPGNIVMSLAQDSSGTVWIGTDKGMGQYKNGEINCPVSEPYKNPIGALLAEMGDKLWFANTHGLYKLENGEITVYSQQAGLIHNQINSLFRDSRGRLWITTARGLSCLADGKFTNYTTRDGLPDNVCYFIVEDERQYLWIGTGKGISRFDGKQFKNYTSRDGLASDEMCQGSCLRDREGYLWFGTTGGITRFDPRLDRVNNTPPPIYIDRFKVFDNAVPLGQELQLKHDQNYITLGFTGISLTAPEKVVYLYHLDGIDRGWFETSQRETSYHYLPPGTFTFRARARNSDGIESREAALFTFHITPPFWQTWWFRLIVLVILSALLVLVVLWRERREKEKIANRERNKQLVMAQKMELLGILAGGAIHDLKNLLSIIIGYSRIAARGDAAKDQTKSDAVERIKSAANTAVQLVKQILAFTRQNYDKTIAANLSDLVDDILEILNVTTPEEIKIHWQRPQQEMSMFINPTKFQQVVMNLCLNAIQAMPGEGELTLSLCKTPNHRIQLEVEDTGNGMEKAVMDKIFDPLFTTKEPGKGTGLGLFVVRQVVREYGGTIGVRSTPGIGTVFTVTFPPAGEK